MDIKTKINVGDDPKDKIEPVYESEIFATPEELTQDLLKGFWD